MGRPWRITGGIFKAGKLVKEVERIVDISSEEDLDAAEKNLRDELSEQAFKLFKKVDLKDVRIEVESETH